MPDPGTEVQGHIPVSEQVYMILLALAEGPLHGYGILLDVEERTGGAVTLGTGTLYSAIKRLRRDGLLDEAPSPAGDADPRRRYYALTTTGHAVVRSEAARHARLADLARAASVLEA